MAKAEMSMEQEVSEVLSEHEEHFTRVPVRLNPHLGESLIQMAAVVVKLSL